MIIVPDGEDTNADLYLNNSKETIIMAVRENQRTSNNTHKWGQWFAGLSSISISILVLVTVNNPDTTWQIVDLVILMVGFILLTIMAFRSLYLYHQQDEI